MKKNLFLLILLYFIVAGCAKIVPPSGGPRDVTPPKLLAAIPPNESVRFSDNRIEFRFDEFVVLKNINSQLLVSPPFKIKPVCTVHGKKIRVRLMDSLKTNTTYILNFGNAIADFNEGNVLKNFIYTFSTDSFIDSMQIAGQVIDAFSLEPEKTEPIVLLYDYFNDTVPRKVRPLYVVRADKSGSFHFFNLKQGQYYIVALNDINNNYLFDLPSEKIAFLDSIIVPCFKSAIDTISDTSITIRNTFFPDSLKLFLFQEQQKTQYIADYKRLTPFHCQIIFFAPNKTKPSIIFLEADSFLTETSKENDTIQLWLPNDTMLLKKDTLTFVFDYSFTSDSGNISLIDTVYLKFKGNYNAKPLTISSLTKFPVSDDSNNILLKFSEPIANIDTNKIFLTVVSESTTDTLPLIIKQEDSIGRQYVVYGNWNYQNKYKLIFDSAAVFSIYNHCNDSTGINITVQDKDYYGTILYTIKTKEQNLIFHLLNTNNIKIREQSFLSKDSLLVFNNLPPGSYKLKVIFDRNNNGKWDTGDLKSLQQPERVAFFENMIEVKSGWTIKYEWEIK